MLICSRYSIVAGCRKSHVNSLVYACNHPFLLRICVASYSWTKVGLLSTLSSKKQLFLSRRITGVKNTVRGNSWYWHWRADVPVCGVLQGLVCSRFSLDLRSRRHGVVSNPIVSAFSLVDSGVPGRQIVGSWGSTGNRIADVPVCGVPQGLVFAK